MKIKFRALLTMCGDPVENGELVIDDGNIVEIATQSDNDDAALDLSDYLLMPGFINAHSHISLTALEKKLSPSDSFVNWIRALISFNCALDKDSRIQCIHSGAEVMRRSGVTALGDYVADPEMLSVIGDLGFRSVLFIETIGFHPEKAQEFCKNVEEVLMRGNPSLICQMGLAPHAAYSVSPELFRSLGQLAQ